MFAQNLDRGFITMRLLCIRDIYKSEFKVEPIQLGKFTVVMYMPWLVKMIWGLCVDLEFFKRKQLLMFFGFVSFISHSLVASAVSSDTTVVMYFMFVLNIG